MEHKILLCFTESGFVWWISHGVLTRFPLNFLLVRAGVLVSRDVTGRVHHLHPAGLTLPATRLVEALLVRAGELGGVCQAGHGRRCHGSLYVKNTQTIQIFKNWLFRFFAKHHFVLQNKTWDLFLTRPNISNNEFAQSKFLAVFHVISWRVDFVHLQQNTMNVDVFVKTADYRDSRYNRRFPFYQFINLLCGVLAAFIFKTFPGQFSQRFFKLTVCDRAAGFIPTKQL